MESHELTAVGGQARGDVWYAAMHGSVAYYGMESRLKAFYRTLRP